MNNNVLAINIGSRSKKYAFFEAGVEKCKSEYKTNDEKSFSDFLKHNSIDSSDLLVGIRIVAPGKIFTEDRLIDDEYINKLIEAESVAPIHISGVVKEISYIKENFSDLKIIAVSDSSFHKSISKQAKTYAIPKKLREELGIERQGYHGLSLSSVVSRVNSELGNVPEKMIVCHLGGGSSITALRDGISADTSMGWTPLEGIPMTERVGDIDPGVVAYLSQKFESKDKDLGKFFSEECGLEAISGIKGGDIPELLEAEGGNADATLALDVYAYKIRKYIGAMASVLGGCDMLVFTGTVGLRSNEIRSRVVKDLEFLNIELDQDKNKSVYEPENIEFIGLSPNERKVAVIPLDEMSEIHKSVLGIQV